MPQYIFKRPGAEISFEAATDEAAWCYIFENHTVNRDYPPRGEVLFRIDRVPVDRPTTAQMQQRQRLMQAATNMRSNRQ